MELRIDRPMVGLAYLMLYKPICSFVSYVMMGLSQENVIQSFFVVMGLITSSEDMGIDSQYFDRN